MPDWVWLVGLAGLGYLVYRLSSAIPKAAHAATNAIAQKIADIWLSLPYFGLTGQLSVLGNLKLPDGTLVPLNTLQSGQVRQDPSVNPPAVYAQVGQAIYQLSPSDEQGNYPASYVGAAPTALESDFGVTNPGGW